MKVIWFTKPKLLTKYYYSEFIKNFYNVNKKKSIKLEMGKILEQAYHRWKKMRKIISDQKTKLDL